MVWVYLYVDHGGQDIPIWFLMVSMGLGFVYSICEYIFTKGSFDSKGIKFISIWAGERQYLWENLDSISYSEIFKWYVFQFNDGEKIRISTYMNGQNELFDILEELEDEM